MEKISLDTAISAHLDTIPRDGMDIFLLEDAQVRGCVLNATRLVNEMRANHQLGILESLALGHAAIGALLCSNQLKGEDRFVLSMECEGPLQGFAVECSAEGQVRGYLKVDQIPLSAPLESFDLSPFIGHGHLAVTKILQNAKEPFTGTVELKHGSIARDLAHYFHSSEQIQTALALSVFFDPQGMIRGAGGIFLQAMPNADSQILDDLEDWLHEIPSIGKTLSEACTPSQLMHQQFRAFRPEMIGSRDAEFFCPCSRERFLRYLLSMNEADRQTLRLHNPDVVTVTCHNCATSYEYPHAEIEPH